MNKRAIALILFFGVPVNAVFAQQLPLDTEKENSRRNLASDYYNMGKCENVRLAEKRKACKEIFERNAQFDQEELNVLNDWGNALAKQDKSAAKEAEIRRIEVVLKKMQYLKSLWTIVPNAPWKDALKPFAMPKFDGDEQAALLTRDNFCPTLGTLNATDQAGSGAAIPGLLSATPESVECRKDWQQVVNAIQAAKEHVRNMNEAIEAGKRDKAIDELIEFLRVAVDGMKLDWAMRKKYMKV